MACQCIHVSQHMVFPVYGPQPGGPAANWPVYFVPDHNDPGMGMYFCPKCKDGLAAARASASMPTPDGEPSGWQRLKNKIRGFFDSLESPRHLSA